MPLVHKLSRRPADLRSLLFTLRWTSLLSSEGRSRWSLLYQCKKGSSVGISVYTYVRV